MDCKPLSPSGHHPWATPGPKRHRSLEDPGLSLAPFPDAVRRAWGVMQRLRAQKEATHGLGDTLEHLKDPHDLVDAPALF